MPHPADDPPPAVPTLDYAKPRPRRPRRTPRTLIFLFATLAVLFGLLFLAAAALLLIDRLQRPPRPTPKDIFGITMLTILGVFTAAVGVNWFRDARRARRRGNATLD